MMVAQAAGTARMFKNPGAGAARLLGVLGLAMSIGFSTERVFHESVRNPNRSTTPIVAGGESNGHSDGRPGVHTGLEEGTVEIAVYPARHARRFGNEPIWPRHLRLFRVQPGDEQTEAGPRPGPGCPEPATIASTPSPSFAELSTDHARPVTRSGSSANQPDGPPGH